MSSELVFEGGATSASLQLQVSPTARVMRLRVDQRTGAVVLTVPRRVSRKRALEWAAGHRPWIERQLAQIAPPERLCAGGTIPLYDIPHRIDWTAGRPRTVKLQDGSIVVGGDAEGLEKRLLRWLARHALEVLSDETREFAGKAEVTVARVGVGDPLSRWGSCSSSGGIRYSWRLILAPEFVRRATVAHEVAHRIHMHHGPEFHELVEALLGADPTPARLWLRQRGALLHRIGRSA